MGSLTVRGRPIGLCSLLTSGTYRRICLSKNASWICTRWTRVRHITVTGLANTAVLCSSSHGSALRIGPQTTDTTLRLTSWSYSLPDTAQLGMSDGGVGVVPLVGASTSSKRHRNNTEGPSTAFKTSLNCWATSILGISANHQPR